MLSSNPYEADALHARRNAGLDPADPFRPDMIAYDLRVTLRSLSRHAARHGLRGREMLPLLCGDDADSFTAVWTRHRENGLIVFNDGLEAVRRREGIAEEFAHLLLGHVPEPAFDHRGLRNYDAGREAQARRFADALLVSPEAAFVVRRMGLPLSVAASRLSVRESLLVNRMLETGALSISPDPRVHAPEYAFG